MISVRASRKGRDEHGLIQAHQALPGLVESWLGGIGVIYYWWAKGGQFWLFTVYGKDVQDDLTAAQKSTLRKLLDTELRMRVVT